MDNFTATRSPHASFRAKMIAAKPEILTALRAAKEHISDPKMWYQGCAFEGQWKGCEQTATTPCCGIGSVLFNTDEAGPARAGAVTALNKVVYRDTQCIFYVDFNDSPDTTHAAVMAMFDKAMKFVSEDGLASTSASEGTDG